MSDSQRYHEIEHQWGRYCCFLSEKCRILTIFLSIAAYKRTSHFYRELHLPVIILGRKCGITRSFMIRRIWTIREQGRDVVKVIALKRSFFLIVEIPSIIHAYLIRHFIQDFIDFLQFIWKHTCSGSESYKQWSSESSKPVPGGTWSTG